MSYRGYVYPFYPSARKGRIDQGQDFGGTGRILAIGDAQVVKTGAPGWPGGAGVLYRLLDGPQRGKYVYVYEGIRPTVRAGQRVEAGGVIGQMIPGSSTGVETGWADSQGAPLSHAEYHEGLETRAGKAFARFLEGLQKTGSASSSGSGGPSIGGAAALSALGALPAVGPLFQALGNAPEDVQRKVIGAAGEFESGIASEVLAGIVGALAKDAEPLMLNVALVGGGAFLVYYGAALLAGVEDPGLKLLRAGRRGAEAGAAVA